MTDIKLAFVVIFKLKFGLFLILSGNPIKYLSQVLFIISNSDFGFLYK